MTNKELSTLTKVIEWLKLAWLIGLSVLFVFTYIALFSNYFKPNAAWVKNNQIYAIIIAILTSIFVGWKTLFVQRKWQNIKQLLQFFLALLIFAWMGYLSFMYAVPSLLHQNAYSTQETIEVIVTDKWEVSSRGSLLALGCVYRVGFEHPDIPNKNFACASESVWNEIGEGTKITLQATKSSVGYKLDKLE